MAERKSAQNSALSALIFKEIWQSIFQYSCGVFAETGQFGNPPKCLQVFFCVTKVNH